MATLTSGPGSSQGLALAPPAHPALHLHRRCGQALGMGTCPQAGRGAEFAVHLPSQPGATVHRGLDLRTRVQPSRQSLLPQSLSCLAFWMSTEPSQQVGCARSLGL